jgi:hypothetical protein
MLERDTLSRARVTRRGALRALAGLAIALAHTDARADDPFQIRFNIDRGGAGPARVQGTVFNEARLDVLDVYVTAEALDAGGKVIGRGIAFVAGSIPQRSAAPFVVNIPAAQNAASFRVRVSSFRYGAGLQTG